MWSRSLHPRVIANALGAVYAAGGAAMLVPMLYALIVADGNAAAFAVPALGTLVAGTLVFFLTRSERPYVSGRDVSLIVPFGWLGVGAAGGAAMLVPMLYALIVADGNAAAFAVPALGTLVAGTLVFFLTRSERPYVSGRDVYLIVTFGWVGVAAAGCIPFVLSGLMGPA